MYGWTEITWEHTALSISNWISVALGREHFFFPKLYNKMDTNVFIDLVCTQKQDYSLRMKKKKKKYLKHLMERNRPSHYKLCIWKASLYIWYQILLKELDQYKVTTARNPDGIDFSQLKLAALVLAHLSIPVV